MSAPRSILTRQMQGCVDWLTNYSANSAAEAQAIAEVRAIVSAATTQLDDAHDLLRHALAACNEKPRFRLRSFNCTSYDLARWIEGWLTRNGGAP